MLGRPALGYQDYEEIITENIFYIDKTDFIREWWEYGDKVTLITRPRRFGKTLNMSTIECFFSNKYSGRSDLFEGKAVWNDEKYRALQGTFPVIFLSFASVKTGSINEIKAVVKQIISDVYHKHRDMISSDVFNDNDRAYYNSINDNMPDEATFMAINRLCGYMEQYFSKKVIILLDEYDTPMQESWLAGNWDETVGFFRSFFNATFKTNNSLYRGIITGITRISKESIFSDLNNLKVVTTTSDKYAAYFGFSEDEVFVALDTMGLGQEKMGVKKWYDGFTFGTHTDIYNPWSITSFIEAGGIYDTYWSNTSGNGLVNSLIQKGNPSTKQTMEELLQGKSFKTKIDEQIVFINLDNDANAVWSLLLATGYLKVLQAGILRSDEEDDICYTLALTNLEIKKMFRKMVKGWFSGNAATAYNNFLKALLMNDLDAMNEFMNKVALHSFSSFDTAKGSSDDDAPERFYHGFVLGLMVELAGRYTITSNRESGFGRYDVMLVPADAEKDLAYIIEFKVHKPKKEKDLAQTVANALQQIEEKHYSSALEAKGITPDRIRKYGFAFKGKECLIG